MKLWTLNRTAFLMEAKNKEQSEKLTNIETNKTYGCTVEKYGRFNHIKGLIFLKEFDIEDMQEFKEGLQESYCSVEVERASYIKARSGATAYVITLNQEHLPFSIYMQGEKQDTRVQTFENTPMICSKCQSYGHTAKRCNREMVCKLCAEKGHSKQECLKSGEEYKCVHCAGNHREQEEEKHTGESFAQMFDCKMSENDKRKDLPWMLKIIERK